MRLSNFKMSDSQEDRLNGLKMTPRSELAKSLETMVREECPFPITYDVNCTQPVNFTEFTYTEFTSGLAIFTQSVEINARIIESSIAGPRLNMLDAFAGLLTDKYELSELPEKWQNKKHVCFMPGHNLLDLASTENIARLFHENDEVVLKPHPITSDEVMSLFGKKFGWNRIVPRDVSGCALLKNCDVVYTTTASEMAITGTALGKKVINMTNFFHEALGAYYPISRILFKRHEESIAAAQDALDRILSCDSNGIILPFNVDHRGSMVKYFAKSLDFRNQYKFISAPLNLLSAPTKTPEPSFKK